MPVIPILPGLQRSFSIIATCMLALACREHSGPAIQIVMGANSDQQANWSPKSAFAEYVGLPSQGDQLSITLTNYANSCEEYRPTPEGGIMVTLTFMFPPGQHPAVGSYPWPGLPTAVPPNSDPELKSPIVLPVVRQGSRSVNLLPGGSVDLLQVSLDRQGEIRGAMRLEQSGGDGQPSTRLFGTFSARVCRTTNQTGAMGL